MIAPLSTLRERDSLTSSVAGTTGCCRRNIFHGSLPLCGAFRHLSPLTLLRLPASTVLLPTPVLHLRLLAFYFFTKFSGFTPRPPLPPDTNSRYFPTFSSLSHIRPPLLAFVAGVSNVIMRSPLCAPDFPLAVAASCFPRSHAPFFITFSPPWYSVFPKLRGCKLSSLPDDGRPSCGLYFCPPLSDQLSILV